MTMQTPQSGQTLSHYRLLEKIGEGGMGVVWKAQDTVLGRTVAIKVLPADVAGDETRRKMFLDEARLASSVSDAHIAQVHELGREGDLDFIVMEYVEGKPLHRILHGRPLPTDKVAVLGHQVAQALSRAHRKGLLHRDLKPGNILVTPDGEAKVVDFGLATLFEARDETLASMALDELPTATQDHTGTDGARRKRAGLVGTLQYMSPEQARAEKLDARSDIFSLGVVLYEMTTGQRPFGGATPADLLREVARARPRPPHELLPKIPLDLERIIVKAMAGAKAERYQTMDDMAVDLRRLSRDLESGSSPSFDDVRAAPVTARRPWMWGLVGVSALAVTVLAGWRFASSGRSAGDPRTVLILPMEVRGQSGDAEYVGHAFAEAIAVQLAQSKQLNVLPVPNREEAPAGGARERGAAAAALGAGRLVTGSLTREGKVVRASLSLVDASRNRIIWGLQKDDADGSLSGLAAVFAAGIRTELGITPTRMYEYPVYMTGSGAMATAPETAAVLGALRRFEVRPALEATERLVKAFPNNPDALVLRAYAVRRTVGTDLLEPDALEKALMVVERIDPQNATARNIECDRLQDRRGNGQAVLDCADGLLSRTDLTPALRGWALRVRASGKMSLGDLNGALQDIHEATQMDPTNPFNFQQLGSHEMKNARFDAAAVAFGQCSSLMPDYYACHEYRAEALVRSGKYAEAVDEARKACEIAASRYHCAYFAFCLAKAGQSAEAQGALMSAMAIKGEGADGAYEFARALLALGDRSAALRYLRLFATSADAPYAKPDEERDFASLYEDAEFKAIVVEQRATIARTQGANGAARD